MAEADGAHTLNVAPPATRMAPMGVLAVMFACVSGGMSTLDAIATAGRATIPETSCVGATDSRPRAQPVEDEGVHFVRLLLVQEVAGPLDALHAKAARKVRGAHRRVVEARVHAPIEGAGQRQRGDLDRPGQARSHRARIPRREIEHRPVVPEARVDDAGLRE